MQRASHNIVEVALNRIGDSQYFVMQDQSFAADRNLHGKGWGGNTRHHPRCRFQYLYDKTKRKKTHKNTWSARTEVSSCAAKKAAETSASRTRLARAIPELFMAVSY
jgi:hypothetical protein